MRGSEDGCSDMSRQGRQGRCLLDELVKKCEIEMNSMIHVKPSAWHFINQRNRWWCPFVLFTQGALGRWSNLICADVQLNWNNHLDKKSYTSENQHGYSKMVVWKMYLLLNMTILGTYRKANLEFSVRKNWGFKAASNSGDEAIRTPRKKRTGWRWRIYRLIATSTAGWSPQKLKTY